MKISKSFNLFKKIKNILLQLIKIMKNNKIIKIKKNYLKIHKNDKGDS